MGQGHGDKDIDRHEARRFNSSGGIHIRSSVAVPYLNFHTLIVLAHVLRCDIM